MFNTIKNDDRSLVRKLYSSFVVGSIKNTDDEPNVQEWLDYLLILPEPKNCFEESYNKYLCRIQYFSFRKRLTLNFLAFLALIPAFIRCLSKEQCLEEMPAIGLLLIEEREDVALDDIFPEPLFKAYKTCEKISEGHPKTGRLCSEARQLFYSVVRQHPFKPYYLYYVLKELSVHSDFLLRRNPEAVAVYVNERNIACPLLTMMYEQSGRKLISFMHGHYLFQLIQAYTRFSEYYVWDERYIPMFKNDLHCNIETYHVYTPAKLQKKWNLESIEPEYDFTYYFSGEKEGSLSIIADVARILRGCGAKFKVRPHPRYSHWDAINTTFAEFVIEDPAKVSMHDSLASTRYALGLETTVLYEAVAEGRGIVIDDIGNPEKYANLQARKSMILCREHLLLSEVVAHYEHEAAKSFGTS